jgi:hypothetical protein
VDGRDSRQEIEAGVGFDDITAGADAHRVFCDSHGIMLADENDTGVGRELENSPGSFDSADSGKANIQEHDVGMKLFGLLDGLFAVGDLPDELDFGAAGKDRTKATPGYVMIVHEQ